MHLRSLSCEKKIIQNVQKIVEMPMNASNKEKGDIKINKTKTN
jgi:hypothetical protein